MASLKKINKKYYIQYYVGKEQLRIPTRTGNLQMAKVHLNNFQTALAEGGANPLPTRTRIAKVLEDYVLHLYTVKRDRNAQKIISYLREVFGPICTGLKIKNQKIAAKAAKCKAKENISPIKVAYLEEVTTAAIAQFIGDVVRSKGVKGKTANRYREILTRLYNWAMNENGIRMPGGMNPAAKVGKYREGEMDITYLTLEQIDIQMAALKGYPLLEVMVAVFIYAGLRREEALWLTGSDVDLTLGTYGVIKVRAKTVNGEYWEPKTGKNRIVPLSSNLRAYLDKYFPAESDGDWYFPSPGGNRWDPDNFSEYLREINLKASVKLGETKKDAKLRWTAGDYRHTFGSQLAMRGESLFKIAKMMGNSPIICEKHYAALSPDSLGTAVEFTPVKAENKPSTAMDNTRESAPKALEIVEPVEQTNCEHEHDQLNSIIAEKFRPRLRLVVNNS